MNTKSLKKGFTLLELLIVIAILAILATIAVLVINPLEYLRQARDSQRINDLAAVKSATDLFVANSTSSSPITAGFRCASSAASGAGPFASSTATCTPTTSNAIDGSGWAAVALSTMAGGSPLPKLPTDPLGTSDANFYYAYAGTTTPNVTYELDAKLESTKYSPMMSSDGGNQSAWYEIGTSVAF